jgi:hypothetical protein
MPRRQYSLLYNRCCISLGEDRKGRAHGTDCAMNSDRQTLNAWIGIGVAFGISLGAAFGAAFFDNVGIGVAIGVGIGISIGLAIGVAIGSARSRGGRGT